MAKYKIIPSSRTIVQSPISIGHKAEKGVEAIEFDVTAWVETYGSGTLTVIMRRWGDAIPYPIALEIDENNKATWTLSDTDTAKAGMAYAQLSYIVGDEVVKKSDIYTFRVMDSLTGEGEPPEAYESWLEHLTHFAAEAMAEVLDIEGIVTDKTLTVDGGIADGKATGDALALKADKSTTYTKSEVDQMIEDVEIETDTTLSVSGAPADAKKTGDALSALEDQFGEETDKLKADLGALTEPQRLADGTDLNTVLTPGVYMLHSAYSYPNKPTSDGEHGILEVWHEKLDNNTGRTFQRLTYTYKAGRTNAEVWTRSYSVLSSTWNNWMSDNVGLSNEIKTLILLCFAHVGEWSDGDGRKYYNALVAALSGEKILSGITATYTSSGHTVYHWDSLDSLKPYISVNAVYADGTTETITDYILTGNLKNTSSIVTVNYMGKTTTISVSVSTDSDLLYYVPSGAVIDGTNATGIDTGIKLADTNKAVTILFDATDELILTGAQTKNFIHAVENNNAGYNAILMGSASNGWYIKKYGLFGGVGGLKATGELPNSQHRLLGAITHAANSNSSSYYLYVDGQTMFENETVSGTFNTTDVVLFVGKRSTGGYNWKGTINKFAVLNRALSLSEIKTLLGVS